MLACAAKTNIECWVHQDIILDNDKAHQSVKEAWEHEDDRVEHKTARSRKAVLAGDRSGKTRML